MVPGRHGDLAVLVSIIIDGYRKRLSKECLNLADLGDAESRRCKHAATVLDLLCSRRLISANKR